MTEFALRLLPRSILNALFRGNDRAIKSYDMVQKEALVELPIGVETAQNTANLAISTAETNEVRIEDATRSIDRLSAESQINEAERQEFEERVTVSISQLSSLVQGILGDDLFQIIADMRSELTNLRALVEAARGDDLGSEVQQVQQEINGLGTAAVENMGTSGHTVPFLDGVNTWSVKQTFTLAPTAAAYEVSGVQVMGARITGWTAWTGTADRATHATYTAPVISPIPTQAEVQAIADGLQDVSRAYKALNDDARTQGFIGT